MATTTTAVWERDRFVQVKLDIVRNKAVREVVAEYGEPAHERRTHRINVGLPVKCDAEAFVLAWWHVKRQSGDTVAGEGLRYHDERFLYMEPIAAVMLRVAVAASLRQVQVTVLSLALSSHATPMKAQLALQFLKQSGYLDVVDDDDTDVDNWNAPVLVKGLWVHALTAADKLERLGKSMTGDGMGGMLY